jgi:hypothetical protein
MISQTPSAITSSGQKTSALIHCTRPRLLSRE